MTLWEIGKVREGWVNANTPKKDEGQKEITEDEFEKLMAMEIEETDEELSIDDIFGKQKPRS